VLFFAHLNHCEAIPQPFQAEFINPGKVEHEISDGALMFLVSPLGQYQTAIFVGLNEGIEFGFECRGYALALISSPFDFISRIGKAMVDVGGEQKAEETRKRELSEDDIIHIWFWFLIFVILISMISFWATQQLFYCNLLFVRILPSQLLFVNEKSRM
jgi:hypothetical protein